MSDNDLLIALNPPEADDSGSSEASNRTSISVQSTRLLLNASQVIITFKVFIGTVRL